MRWRRAAPWQSTSGTATLVNWPAFVAFGGRSFLEASAAFASAAGLQAERRRDRVSSRVSLCVRKPGVALPDIQMDRVSSQSVASFVSVPEIDWIADGAAYLLRPHDRDDLLDHRRFR